MNILHKIAQPEGRRLELKEVMPTKAEFAKTIISFANDAGGELFIGVKNNPRKISGIQQSQLDAIENQISNIIHDQCRPTILPEIDFIEHHDTYILRVYIHKGNQPPYFIASKGKEHGTYIRVGSSNRVANKQILQELERQGQQISFDSEVYFKKKYQELRIETFKEFFEEKTGENLSLQILKKLALVKQEQGQLLPTHA